MNVVDKAIGTLSAGTASWVNRYVVLWAVSFEGCNAVFTIT